MSVIGIKLNHMVSSMLPALPADMELNKSLHKHTDYNVISSRSCLLTTLKRAQRGSVLLKLPAGSILLTFKHYMHFALKACFS